MLMNLLVATARQYHPVHEWILAGVRALVGKANWTIYCGASKNSTNTFRHESLLPFSAAIIAGGSKWLGKSYETFFGVLAKHRIPLLAFGLELPQEPSSLSKDELSCFLREGNLITVKDRDAQHFFQRYDLSTAVMPCPSLFAYEAKPRNRRSKVGYVLQSTSVQQRPISEATLRELCVHIKESASAHPVDVICPMIDDFMRFSLMYPKLVKYSYDAKDYNDYFSECDVIVTTSPEAAAFANSRMRPALLLLESESAKSFDAALLPFTSVCSISEIQNNLRKFLFDDGLEEKILMWKLQCEIRWQRLLSDHLQKVLPHEPRHFSAHA